MSEQRRVGSYVLGACAEISARTETHRARQEPLGRAVWLKHVRPDVEQTAAAVAELEGEAQRMSRLTHPSLTMMVEYLPDEHAIAYAEPGVVRLDELCERSGKLEPMAATAIALETGRAVAVLHGADIVHGWLRPEHVELGAAGTVRLHGWGCSPFAAAHRPPVENSLEPPENLAPEQVLGDSTDARSDVFLLGSLLFVTVTGRRPFAGEGGVVHRLRHEPAPRLRRLVPHIPAELESIVARCLDRRPAHRPDITTANCELLAVLRRHAAWPTDALVQNALARAGLADEPKRPRGFEAAAHTPSRRTLHAGVALAVVGVVALVGAVALSGATQAPAPAAGGAVGVEPARLRILAQPWADVDIDGRYVDTTPIGLPLEVAPGHHMVRFRHPAAPDEVRDVDIGLGQTIVLDVTMALRHPELDAAPPPVPFEDQEP